MLRGKRTCKILKEIRKQIADANDIEYVISECKFKGDCLGTCPKCEAEVRYLEEQLQHRSMMGKAVVLAGISLNTIVANAAPEEPVITYEKQDTIEVVDSSLIVTGRVFDDFGNIALANIVIKDSNNKITQHTVTNGDGRFSVKVDSFPQILEAHYLGYETFRIPITVSNHKDLSIKMIDNGTTTGLFVTPNDLKKVDKSEKKEAKQRKRYTREAITRRNRVSGIVYDDFGACSKTLVVVFDGDEKVKNKRKIKYYTVTDENGLFTLNLDQIPETLTIQQSGAEDKNILVTQDNRNSLCIRTRRFIVLGEAEDPSEIDLKANKIKIKY